MDDVTLGAEAWTDGELLDRTRAGNRHAFGRLYERHHELVLAFLLKRTHNPAVAMDMMAETFAVALLALVDDSPAIVGSAAPWLLTIARNTMIESHKHGRVQGTARERLALEPLQINNNDVQQVLRGMAETDLLIRLSEELPPDQFDALRARVLDQRGYQGIAQTKLAYSAAIVRQRVSHARTFATDHQGIHTGALHHNYSRQLITVAGALFPRRRSNSATTRASR